MKIFFFTVCAQLFFSFVYAGQDEVARFNDYKIIISRKEGMFGDIKIFKENKKVFEEKAEYFYFLPNSYVSSEKINIGDDINKNGISDLVVLKSTGGVHCCQYLYLFELGDQLKKILEIDGGSYGFKFIDLDGDKIPEIEFWDWPIDELFTSFALSSQGKVIMKYDKDRYKVAFFLMKKNKPSSMEIKKIEERMRQSFNKDRHEGMSIILEIIMELSYSGHHKLALDIAERSWPKDKLGDFLGFKKKLMDALNESPYWREFSKNI
ncbi:MAG: hypothetical protein ACOVP4_13710 [Bacteriovoracaceae bacterium]